MGAGLPSYVGLVEHCFQELTHPLPQPSDYQWHWPDRMLGALESRYSPERVRNIVCSRLKRRPRDLSLHRAILRLAQLRRHNGIRLVTTNFDTYFEKARRAIGLKYEWHAGPVVPIPKNDRAASWRSLVYLHGRLGASTNHLVLSSADFGKAYLTDAWAARFVSQLFSDFKVLFIGYSLNDPVLRYMTDAFAAEEAETRFRHPRGPAYIFTPVADDDIPDPQPYTDRNLEPIFYRSSNNHNDLKRTIISWADARDDYLSSVRQLINDIAPRRPDAIDPTDTANLLWAVAGRPGDNGHGARVFAGVENLPPIEWFDAFDAREVKLEETAKSAAEIAAQAGRQPPARASLDLSPLFPLMADRRELELTPVGYALIQWLVRHLKSEGLVERVLRKLAEGRHLHAHLRHSIRERLAEESDFQEGFLRFWRIVASEGQWMSCRTRPVGGPAWVVRSSIGNGADPAWLRQEVMASLRPSLQLSPSSYRSYRKLLDPSTADNTIGNTLSELAIADVFLSDDSAINTMIERIDEINGNDTLWGDLIDDLTSLLAQTLHLYAAAGNASASRDPSEFLRPSIVPHRQNRTHRNWTILFDLIWRGWIHIDGSDAGRSRATVWRWRGIPYHAFRRLVLAAMNHSPHFSASERMEALLNV